MSDAVQCSFRKFTALLFKLSLELLEKLLHIAFRWLLHYQLLILFLLSSQCCILPALINNDGRLDDRDVWLDDYTFSLCDRDGCCQSWLLSASGLRFLRPRECWWPAIAMTQVLTYGAYHTIGTSLFGPTLTTSRPVIEAYSSSISQDQFLSRDFRSLVSWYKRSANWNVLKGKSIFLSKGSDCSATVMCFPKSRV